MSVRPIPLRALLGGGLVYFALFVVVHAVLGFLSDGVTVGTTVCLVLVAAPQLAFARRQRLDLPVRQTWAIALALIAAAVIGLWSIDPARMDRTYVAWFLGAIAFDLLGLAIVGRFRAAWITMAAVAVIAVLWSLTHGMSVADGIGLVVRHAATLLVGTLIAISLRRSNAAFERFRARRIRRTADEQAARAQTAARRDAALSVLEQAGPTLEAIASGATLSDGDRARMLALEGDLRDQIRAPRLVQGSLRESAEAARRRGVDVTLMDEADGAAPASRTAAAAWLAERLDRIADGRFVGRLRATPEGVRVSAVSGDPCDVRSLAEEVEVGQRST